MNKPGAAASLAAAGLLAVAPATIASAPALSPDSVNRGLVAEAAGALREGRVRDAVALLRPLVHPGRLDRSPTVHATLGDAYARLGRPADAQAQWRIALALAATDPRFDRDGTRRRLDAAIVRGEGETVVPVLRLDGRVVAIDLGSMGRTFAGIVYDRLERRRDEPDGAAYRVERREMDCSRPRVQVLARERWAADRRLLPSEGILHAPSWQGFGEDPWARTEQALVCTTPGLAGRGDRHARRLRALRSDEADPD